MGFFDKLKQGLSKTKESFNEKINNVRCWNGNIYENNRKFKR